VKKICLFVNLLLIVSLSATAQYRAQPAVRPTGAIDSLKPFPRSIVPANYTAGNLGFFCKKEWLLEKSTKIPLRFRLGSVSYCDALEGKNKQYIIR